MFIDFLQNFHCKFRIILNDNYIRTQLFSFLPRLSIYNEQKAFTDKA